MIVEELIGLLGFDLTGEEKLRRFTGGLKGAGATLAAFARTAAVFGAAAATAVAGGMAALGVSAIKVGAEFEDLQAVLETIEGSSEKAKASLNWVQQFATKTPYDVKKVSDAFVALKAYGLEPQSGLLESIGNAASAMNKDLMQGVEAVADAVRGENERLKEFGIVGSKAGEKITYTWSQNGKTLTKTVKNDAAEIQKALQGIFDSRFLGAMEKRSTTFNGIVSNIGDMWSGFQRKIADAGLFDWVKAQFQGVLGTLQQFLEDGTLDRVTKTISDTLVATGEAVKDLLRSITIDDVTGFITGAIRFLMGIGRAFRSVIEAVGYIGQLIASFTGLKDAWKGVVLALGGIGLLVAPWATAFAAIILAVDDFVAFLQGRPSVIGDALAAIKSKFNEWLPSIQGAWNSFMAVFQQTPEFKFLEGAINRLGEYGLDKILQSWKEAGQELWSGIGALGKGLWDVGAAIGALFNSGADGKQASMIGAYADVLGRFVGSSLIAGLQNSVGIIRQIANAFETFGEVLSKLAQGDLAGAFQAWVDGIKRQGQIAVETIQNVVQAFIPDFDISEAWAAISSAFEAFVVKIEGLAERVRAALSNMWPEPPEWWKQLTGAYEQRKAASDAGSAVGGMFRPQKKPMDNGVPMGDQVPSPINGAAPQPSSPSAAPRSAPPSSPAAPGPDLSGALRVIGDAAAKLQVVSGPQAAESVVNTVANDNRVSNVTNTVNAPVSITATTNASPAQIGAAAGSGVQRAGDNVNRSLAVTSAPGGMAK